MLLRRNRFGVRRTWMVRSNAFGGLSDVLSRPRDFLQIIGSKIESSSDGQA